MPLFSSKQRTPSPPPVHANSTKHGLFSRRHDSPPSRHDYRRSSESSHTSRSSTSSHHHGILSRHHDDATIAAARTKVRDAERAETRADQALRESKALSHEARSTLGRLVAEASADAKAAKAKRHEADKEYVHHSAFHGVSNAELSF